MAVYREFTGIAKWAKLHKPDPKFGNYEIDLYVDDATAKDIRATGVQLKQREDAEGIFFKFRRPAQRLNRKTREAEELGPVTVIKDGKVFSGEVGNGSEVAVLIDVYETVKGIAHRLEMVRVEKLVEFNPNAKPEGWDYEDQPAFD